MFVIDIKCVSYDFEMYVFYMVRRVGGWIKTALPNMLALSWAYQEKKSWPHDRNGEPRPRAPARPLGRTVRHGGRRVRRAVVARQHLRRSGPARRAGAGDKWWTGRRPPAAWRSPCGCRAARLGLMTTRRERRCPGSMDGTVDAAGPCGAGGRVECRYRQRASPRSIRKSTYWSPRGTSSWTVVCLGRRDRNVWFFFSSKHIIVIDRERVKIYWKIVICSDILWCFYYFLNAIFKYALFCLVMRYRKHCTMIKICTYKLADPANDALPYISTEEHSHWYFQFKTHPYRCLYSHNSQMHLTFFAEPQNLTLIRTLNVFLSRGEYGTTQRLSMLMSALLMFFVNDCPPLWVFLRRYIG